MNINLVDSAFSADYFALGEDNQPVCTDKFLRGLQVLATQATSAISNHEVVEEAFERIQNAKWEHISTETKDDLNQKIAHVSQVWVKVCFGEQFRHVPRERLEKNSGPKFHAQYTSKMKDASKPMLELLLPEGISVDDYDKTIVKAFLDYFQTGTLSVNALNASILDLISLAHQHQIEGLITKCTDLLKEQFDDHENLDTIWEFTNEHNIPQLTFACLSYMQANRDKISRELKEKCEEALPVVKALFKNDIILNQSPSGYIKVEIKYFKEETASHIEQLSKLFIIRALFIMETYKKKQLNSGEKLFSFLNKISPTLKDLQELIIWNENPKDNDFLTLKDLFPKLTAYGNHAPFLKTFDDVKTYLIKFKNPDEDDQESEKLVLRSLNLNKIRTLNDVQMTEFTPYLQELYQIYTKSKKITSVAIPKATLIYCRWCISLTTIDAPEATEIYCPCCTALTTIKAPEASWISCNSCTALTTINAPKATKISCDCCTALTTIDAPEATKISCDRCTALTTIDAPKATDISWDHCTALTTIDAPKVTLIDCSNFKSLTSLKATFADVIICQSCTALTTIDAPKAKKIECDNCTALTTIDAPEAFCISCDGCTALTTLKAPKEIRINCQNFTRLTTLEAPEAKYIFCQDCTALITLEAPNAFEINCSGCTALTTLKAPNAIEINCSGCSALNTLETPKARKINCNKCAALITLFAPQATEIDRKDCNSLTNIHAPNDLESLKAHLLINLFITVISGIGLYYHLNRKR